MLKPRNSLVIVRVITKSETMIGNLVVPENDSLYSEAEVMAVGPGTVSAEGGVSETFDLKVGQRVWVKVKQSGPHNTLASAGLRYKEGDEFLYVFEQGSIVGIIAEPGNVPTEKISEPETGGAKPQVLIH